ncbi:hypothetical protein TRFO_32719 [Tritrichomonas foetus]|uniref:Uncharacterized protein n=1 Tax=Tritrichomonas foetus TaxID=1144522 RepID=A0A1J4JPD0_9EUKA|nr:hypothetical protein TRFO_32719 [Tritrichomonas foetus]|eukprot:OHT00602.1 hypothetical protein TRFO_32719 [Tritrichomonas foetus]
MSKITNTQQKKTLNVYYQSILQKLKVFDNTSEEAIFLTIMRIFQIEADIKDVFFQDEDGDILILPSIIPDNLSVYVYIRPTYKDHSGNDTIENNNKNKTQKEEAKDSSLLPGFKWDKTNRYLLKENFDLSLSSRTYTQGKLYCKFLIKTMGSPYQAIGLHNADIKHLEMFPESSDDPLYHLTCYDDPPFLVGPSSEVKEFSMFIDMDNSEVTFIQISNGKVVKNEKHKIQFKNVQIIGYSKHGFIQIIEKGSSPIPSFLENRKSINPRESEFIFTNDF